jgi:DNA polymerase-3 subunit delta'
MPLKDIIGQEAALRTIRGALAAGRITHAFLFVGPGGVGKRTTALAFAQAMNCPQPIDGDGCGVCPVCSRIEHGADMDIRFFSPSRMEYRVDEAKKIREDAYLTSSEGCRKFLILDRADCLNEESGNKLLKVIEEPPEFTVFILLTENADRILPTIRSRTQAVSFRPLSVEEAVRAAGGRMAADEVRYLYPLAKGNVGTILRLSEDKGLKELFDDIEAELFERLLKPVPASPMRLSEEIVALAGRIDFNASEEDTKSIALRKGIVGALEVMMAMVERRYMPRGGGEAGEGGRSGVGARHRTGCRLLETVNDTIKMVEGGGQQALALEAMAIEFRKIVSGNIKEKVS